MNTEQINDHILTKECQSLAQEIFDEITEGGEIDRDAMSDRAHEYADGHEWVIYHYKSHLLCAHCDTTLGEEFLEDVGMPETPTYNNLGSTIAYGEILGRIEQALNELTEAWEEQNESA